MEIGAAISLLSSSSSLGCLLIVSVSVSSPSSSGSQSTESFVRPIAAMRMSLVIVSPLDVVMVTVAAWSRGSELSTENGMRTFLPPIAKVGTSKLSNSTSGKRSSLPTGTVNTGTPIDRNRPAARTGASPWFQSPSDANTTPSKCGCLRTTSSSGLERSVPFSSTNSAVSPGAIPAGLEIGLMRLGLWGSGLVSANGSMTTSARDSSDFQASICVSDAIASSRV
ncbi:hypothetical protein-signal peptide and transmembrane prediction [Rhodopirellula baltica SH 1]|uniref:Uncharacterized protein n=1 Tax=Rhodopirellula baltica (strain DSM 10527 / NCIMB 13988 / SH1) TaxID=243090 RepID=Q7UM83_RHOBA|nr:hypothetical protein-signal peptide and transmembrane prediction [Rhodopirellula baltica SH 1]